MIKYSSSPDYGHEDHTIDISPFALKGEEIEKFVLEHYQWFKNSPLANDLNKNNTVHNRILFDRFREYFFKRFPDKLLLRNKKINKK